MDYKYGWKPDHHDPRDLLFRVSAPVQIKSVDLRETHKVPDIFNQYNLGSCTGNAIAYMLAFNILNKNVQTEKPCEIPFSRLFIYYNERQLEGTVNQDSGAQIRDGLKSISNMGACSEKTWPYNINKFSQKPSGEAYEEAINFRAIEYIRLNSISKQELVGCLLEGFPFVLGFQVFESFESKEVADTGEVDLPSNGEQFMGGHAVCCVGYDMDSDRFIIANSWGAEWGKDGYFTIPADYICNLRYANDFWATKLLM